MTSVSPYQPPSASAVSDLLLIARRHHRHIILWLSNYIAVCSWMGRFYWPTRDFARCHCCFQPYGSIFLGLYLSWGALCALGIVPGTAWRSNSWYASRFDTQKDVVQRVVLWFDSRRGREGVISDGGRLQRPVTFQSPLSGQVQVGHLFPYSKGGKCEFLPGTQRVIVWFALQFYFRFSEDLGVHLDHGPGHPE